MKKPTVLLLFVFFACQAFPRDIKNSLYSGGMLFIQPGYLIAGNTHQQIRENNFGLGGILRFYIFGNMTAGIFGGTTKAHYDSSRSESSYMQMGYGGAFAGFSKQKGKFRYTAAAFAGGGTLRNLHVEKQEGDALSEAWLYKQTVFVFSPILSIDYALTSRLYLSLQTVCLTARMDNRQMLYNPTAQIGLLFYR